MLRTAAGVAGTFICANQCKLAVDASELFGLYMGIASGNMSREEVEERFRTS
jgi:hypothetical protein